MEGSLRTYLGTAPGVGKTYAMLADGRQRAAAGERVVVGWIERKGRAGTRGQLGDLEVIPPRVITYRGSTFADFDVETSIASGAHLVLVDELAHAAPGAARQRWEDVAEVLAAGIDVSTTANVANLRSLRDYAARLTGVGAVEYVPDEFVRSGEVVLVDMPPEALRRRISSGAVFSADQVGGALADYFRASNLEALSELGRAWVDGTVEGVGDDLLVRRGLLPEPAPKLVIAGDSGSVWGERVIHRAAQIAREEDAQLVVVHVNRGDGSARRRGQRLEQHRDLTAELGGTYAEVEGDAPADTLARAVLDRGATRVVVAHHRSRLGELAHGSVSKKLRRLLPRVPVEEVREQIDGSARSEPEDSPEDV